jgi:hypothetical protein
MKNGRWKAVGALAVAAALSTVVATAATGASRRPLASSTSSASSCHLGNGIQHVIEITFDNVHFNRDNPNVLSDLEQMPALTNFITSNGTMLSNNHTPMIGHTADDIITNLSGLYGDRHGQGLTNNYETYNAAGNVTKESSFAYWTSTYGLDSYPNQPYSANVPATGAPASTPPAPWVPYTRAGCDFGGVSTANIELENVKPDIANFFGANSPEQQQLVNDPDPFSDQEVADYVGLGVHCAQGSSFCSTNARPVADKLPDEPGGYNGFQAVFGHKYLQPALKGAANAANGMRTVNGHSYEVYDAAGNLVDLSGHELDGAFLSPPGPGFPGFGPITATQSLAYVADMQESGIPITYGYIGDAHEKKTGQSNCSNAGTAQGPGDSCYRQNLAAYNTAFTTFFQRLADDGITPKNTLFVFAADEGDHFAGANANRAVTPSCTGTPDTTSYSCTYPTGTIGEQQVSIHGLLATQQGDSTPFYNEPQGNSVFITGNPGPTSSTTRTLERDFLKATVNDTYDNATETVAAYAADPEVEQLLHFVDADPNRTPSFTVFPRPDFFLSTGLADPTSNPRTPDCPTAAAADAAAKCVVINNGFAWDHGYYAPEIDNTWLGLVGPGVAHKGVDGFTAGEGPSSQDGSNANPQPVTSLRNPGTWADHTDIRPTILALTGLKDDYIDDGRVLVEDMTSPPGKSGQPKFQDLAVCYKQLNASVGQFGTDMLVADTAALKTGSTGNDSTYQGVLTKIQKLGAARDALATQIKGDLFDAEFNDHPIPGANDLKDCNDILSQANQLAAG